MWIFLFRTWYIFPLHVGAVNKKKKTLFVKLHHQEKYLWYFKCSSYENKQARDTGYDKLVEGMQDAEFTIHDCNTKIKLNVIMSEEIHCFIGTSQLRNTQFYLVWHKAVFGCQIPQSNIQFNFCRNDIHHISEHRIQPLIFRNSSWKLSGHNFIWLW